MLPDKSPSEAVLTALVGGHWLPPVMEIRALMPSQNGTTRIIAIWTIGTPISTIRAGTGLLAPEKRWYSSLLMVSACLSDAKAAIRVGRRVYAARCFTTNRRASWPVN